MGKYYFYRHIEKVKKKRDTEKRKNQEKREINNL